MELSEEYFEFVVVGLGGIGSATLYHLAKRTNKTVLGLEQFELGHSNGGSQDHSRIMRLMYYEPHFVQFAKHTYPAFEEAEEESGIKLFHKIGGLSIAEKGSKGEVLLDKYAAAMTKENVPFERLDGRALSNKFPQWNATEKTVALFQSDGALLDAALCNGVHIQLARKHGAVVRQKCAVTRIQKLSSGDLLVSTTQGRIRCSKLIVTAGAWINEVLGSAGFHIPVHVTQEQVTYIETPRPDLFTKDKFPLFIYHDEGFDVYGLPSHVNSGLKIGLDACGPLVTATNRTFVPDPQQEDFCYQFIQKHLPLGDGPKMYSKTCLYAMTPDRTFVIDDFQKAGWPGLLICNGAGHAFKFAALIGKILSEMAREGRTQFDISRFSATRDAIVKPTTQNPRNATAFKEAFSKL